MARRPMSSLLLRMVLKPAFLFAAFVLALAFQASAQTTAERKGEPYMLPQWFKPSFLDFREDVAEARAEKRHVMVFFHLDDCSWCAKMLKESFESGDNRAFMEKHLDVVAVNMRGAQEAFWTDGSRHTERSLAQHLKVRGTPTLLFLGPDGAIALRLDGYRDPNALREALELVQRGDYRRP
jgi:thioredoxin-related protein